MKTPTKTQEYRIKIDCQIGGKRLKEGDTISLDRDHAISLFMQNKIENLPAPSPKTSLKNKPDKEG